MKLVEIFKDFEVRVKGKSFHSKYDALFIVVPRSNPKTVTLEDLEKYVSDLQKKYPDRNFYLGRKRINGKEYYIITRKKRMKMPDGSVKYVGDRVPIYIDIEEQRFYIPEYYIRKKRRLACYIIMRTLGTLGVSTTKYAWII